MLSDSEKTSFFVIILPNKTYERTKNKMTKLIHTKGFKSNPDLVIAEYQLPTGVKLSKQKIHEDGLWVRIQRLKPNPSARKVRYNKTYYFGTQKQILSRIGYCHEITYAQALKEAKKLHATDLPNQKSKTTLQKVYDKYIALCSVSREWKPRTIEKKKKIFKKLAQFHNTDIKKIKLSDLEAIAERLLLEQRTFAACKDFCCFCDDLFRFAKMKRYIDTDLMESIPMTIRYKTPKSEGHGWIHTLNDLDLLIKYIVTYPHGQSVKNALKMSLLTALRAENIRYLTINHIKQDETGQAVIHFKADEMKSKANGDEYFGLPEKVADWLISLPLGTSGLFFPSQADTPLSDGTLSKALRQYVGLEVVGKIRHHSFRKILSTYINEYSDFSAAEIDRVLSHKPISGSELTYNKSKNIKNSRDIFNWWLSFLEARGFYL